MNENNVHSCISLVWSQKTWTKIKNFADLAPLPLPDIHPNTINFAHNFRCNLDLPPKFILPTLGTTDYLKDIHDYLYLSLIWCRKTCAYQKYAVPVTLPQPDIQPNTINFAQNFPYNVELLPKYILPILRKTYDLKDKHIHLYLSLVWTWKTSTHFRSTLFQSPYLWILSSLILGSGRGTWTAYF